MFKRNYRIKDQYPLNNRDQFLKTSKGITCELYLLDYDWMTEKEVMKRHREFDAAHPKLANKYSPKEIKNGIEKWVKLGYLNKRIV